MTRLIVDIGIACNKNQSKHWWPSVMGLLLLTKDRGVVQIGDLHTIGSAMDDFSKSETATRVVHGTELPDEDERRWRRTDANRSAIAAKHLDGRADAIFWIDDDTAPPDGAIERLADLNVGVAAGAYYKRRPPCNILAFHRTPTGLYRALWNFQEGEIASVDSVGMGCTLVRREVYEEIQRQYVLFRRATTNSLIPVHRDDIEAVEEFNEQIGELAGKTLVSTQGIVRLEQLLGPEHWWGVEQWPFYAMEYLRTEDHYFCEMVKRCGIEILVDTGIECRHWGDTSVSGQNFREMREWYKATHGEGVPDEAA